MVCLFDFRSWLLIGLLGLGCAMTARVPDPVASAPEPSRTFSFEGRWDTDFKAMTLTQKGNRVTGGYDWRDGRVEGTVEKGILRGKWTQSNGRGGFVFRMSGNGLSFSGSWGNGDDDAKGGQWNGKRVSPLTFVDDMPAQVDAAEASFAGRWETDFKAMTLTQKGNRVTGSYDWRDGRVEGVVENGVLRGKWTQSNGSGRFIFRLGRDGQHFTGTWGNGDDDSRGGKWNGRRRGVVEPVGEQPVPIELSQNPSFSGRWETDFKGMTLIQKGNRVTGSYDWRGGQVEGTLERDVLKGTWSQSNGSGRFVFRISEDGQRFSGSWGNGSDDSRGGTWNGRRN